MLSRILDNIFTNLVLNINSDISSGTMTSKKGLIPIIFTIVFCPLIKQLLTYKI